MHVHTSMSACVCLCLPLKMYIAQTRVANTKLSETKPHPAAKMYLFGLVECRPLQLPELVDLIKRQLGEKLQESHNIQVVGVAPKLRLSIVQFSLATQVCEITTSRTLAGAKIAPATTSASFLCWCICMPVCLCVCAR